MLAAQSEKEMKEWITAFKVQSLIYTYKSHARNVNTYSARMSPENTHKLMGFYRKVLVTTRRFTLVNGFCFFMLFLMGCIELKVLSNAHCAPKLTHPQT